MTAAVVLKLRRPSFSPPSRVSLGLKAALLLGVLGVKPPDEVLCGGLLDGPRRAHADVGGERARLREKLLRPKQDNKFFA